MGALGMRGWQRGQAMTEFIVVALLLLIPLLIALRVIGGMLAQQQKMEVAARYAAWERTVWHAAAPPGPGGAATIKSDEHIGREIDRRLFASDERALYSDDDDAYQLDPFLSQLAGGRDALLLPDEVDQELPRYARHSSAESRPDGMVGAIDSLVGALGSVSRFDLNLDGLYRAEVSVALVDLVGAFDLDLEFLRELRIARSNTIFGEAWTAGGPAQAEYLISGLLPQQFMDNTVVSNVQGLIAYAPISRELDDDWLRFGHVTIDPLPPHRLGPTPPP